MLFLGFFLFTDTYVKWYRWTAGTVHAVSHIAATFFIGWGASYFAMTTLGLQYQTPEQLLLTGALIVLGGWIVGSLLLGVYLSVDFAQPVWTTYERSLFLIAHRGLETFSSVAY